MKVVGASSQERHRTQDTCTPIPCSDVSTQNDELQRPRRSDQRRATWAQSGWCCHMVSWRLHKGAMTFGIGMCGKLGALTAFRTREERKSYDPLPGPWRGRSCARGPMAWP